MNEPIVFLMREFGWTLEYTRDLVRFLPVGQLNALLKELDYQKRVENYITASNFAMCLASWASSQGKRKYSVEDFIGEPPTRGADKISLNKLAEEAGIQMPKGE